jgi:hypothetical protein
LQQPYTNRSYRNKQSFRRLHSNSLAGMRPPVWRSPWAFRPPPVFSRDHCPVQIRWQRIQWPDCLEECLVDASRSRNKARLLLVEVANPELTAIVFDIGDVFSIARDGKLGVDVGVAPSHKLIGRDGELHGPLHAGIGSRLPEYSLSNEYQHHNDR